LQLLFIFIDIGDIQFGHRSRARAFSSERIFERFSRSHWTCLEKELHHHRIGRFGIHRVQHVQGIQHGRPAFGFLIVHLVQTTTVITVIGVMDQRVLTVGKILYQPIPVADPVKSFPAADITTVRRIVDDIQRLLEIGVAARSA